MHYCNNCASKVSDHVERCTSCNSKEIRPLESVVKSFGEESLAVSKKGSKQRVYRNSARVIEESNSDVKCDLAEASFANPAIARLTPHH